MNGHPTTDEIESDPELIERITDYFAGGGSPLMNSFGLTIVAAEKGRVRFELKVTPHLTHAGGVLSGQAIMGCMDVGMVFVMVSLAGDEIPPFTTVQLATAFERGVPDDIGTVTFDAFVTKPGRSLVFGQVDLLLPDGRRAASATTTYMWL